ncbi:MAG TPA: type VI secretion system baseplate subunit TssG [Gammaproteobacteria bacterium]|nr:type VI secretion system baseplate subunit TssG [Gammaproteobacteria bacterium]
MGLNYSFYKLAELAENNKKIKFISSPKLSFPVSDVLSYSETTGEVELGFMGLTGVDSALPYYLQSSLLLNKLEHKLYGLFYQAIKKSQTSSSYDTYINLTFGESRENLYKDLKKYFGDIAVTVKEFIPRWIILDSRSDKLGEMILGERVLVSSFVIMMPTREDHVVVGQWIMR